MLVGVDPGWPSQEGVCMSLEQRVVEYLRMNPGKRAREIADALGEDKSEVNSCLYRLRGARRRGSEGSVITRGSRSSNSTTKDTRFKGEL